MRYFVALLVGGERLVEELGLKAGDETSLTAVGKDALAVGRDDRRDAALSRVAAVKLRLPTGYKFDRDEANER